MQKYLPGILLTLLLNIACQNVSTPIESTLAYEQSLRKQNKGNWKNIRILADYSNVDVKLIPSAVSYIQKIYSVYPKKIIDEVKGQSKCVNLTIPPKHSTLGVQNQDFILFVGLQTANGDKWITNSAKCYQDKLTYRPVAGMIVFNTFSLSQYDITNTTDSDWQNCISATVVQLTRIMGFSYGLFDSFVNPKNNVRMGIKSVVKDTLGKRWIILPLVVAQVQSHFNCPSAFGAPLEDYVDSSAWERVTFGNEILTQSSMTNPVYSNFTLKLMESTGWYYVDYSYAQPYVWGMGEGCSIAKGGCPSNTIEFCGSSTNTLCSVDYKAISYCRKDDAYSGGCNYWSSYPSLICSQNSTTLIGITNLTGGLISPISRCWVTSLTTAFGIAGQQSSCFKSLCQGGFIYVLVGSTTYKCTKTGQVLSVSFKGKTATITCPDFKRFCTYDNPCPRGCSGRGNCIKGACQCWSGFTGTDCSKQG